MPGPADYSGAGFFSQTNQIAYRNKFATTLRASAEPAWRFRKSRRSANRQATANGAMPGCAQQIHCNSCHE